MIQRKAERGKRRGQSRGLPRACWSPVYWSSEFRLSKISRSLELTAQQFSNRTFCTDYLWRCKTLGDDGWCKVFYRAGLRIGAGTQVRAGRFGGVAKFPLLRQLTWRVESGELEGRMFFCICDHVYILQNDTGVSNGIDHPAEGGCSEGRPTLRFGLPAGEPELVSVRLCHRLVEGEAC